MSRRKLSVEETVHSKLVLSGEREKLKKAARQQLEESGWTHEVRELCREAAAKQGAASATHESLVQAVRPQARATVPDHIKSELLRSIRAILEEGGA